MVKPTPTQAENDAAALGQHVMNKEHDGSEPDLAVNVPDVDGVPVKTRAMEAAKPAGTYQTRAAARPVRPSET